MATYKNPYKGKTGVKTPSGVMPEDIAIRHGLTGVNSAGASDASYRKTYWRKRSPKAMFEAIKRYRQSVHKVNEPRLATTLRDAVHYFLEPMSRGTSTNQDRSSDEGSAQTVLKV